jgi:hypothetical protein
LVCWKNQAQQSPEHYAERCRTKPNTAERARTLANDAERYAKRRRTLRRTLSNGPNWAERGRTMQSSPNGQNGWSNSFNRPFNRPEDARTGAQPPMPKENENAP